MRHLGEVLLTLVTVLASMVLARPVAALVSRSAPKSLQAWIVLDVLVPLANHGKVATSGAVPIRRSEHGERLPALLVVVRPSGKPVLLVLYLSISLWMVPRCSRRRPLGWLPERPRTVGDSAGLVPGVREDLFGLSPGGGHDLFRLPPSGGHVRLRLRLGQLQHLQGVRFDIFERRFAHIWLRRSPHARHATNAARASDKSLSVRWDLNRRPLDPQQRQAT
jgi:hypothetical protein